MSRPVLTHKLWLILPALVVVASSLMTLGLIKSQHGLVRSQLVGMTNGVYRFVVEKSDDRVVLRGNGYLFSVDGWPSTVVVHPGDLLLVKARFRFPRSKRNPYDFDEESYAQSKQWLGFLYSVKDVIVDHSTHQNSVHFARFKARTAIRKRIDTRYSALQSREIVIALILGDRSELKEKTVENFRQTGLGHILAISGLHMGILASLAHLSVWIVLRRIPIQIHFKRLFSVLISIAFVCVFAFIVAPSPSVIRSAVMICLVLLASINHNKWLPFSVLGIAFIFILVFRPADIVSVGFWLSFAAVGTIIFVLNHANKRENSNSKRPFLQQVRAACTVSIAAMCGTVPLLTYSFGFFPLATVFISPVAVFLLSLALPTALVATVLPIEVPSFLTFSDTLIQLIQVLAKKAASATWIPTWTAPVHSIPWWIIPFFSLGLLVLYHTNQKVRIGILSFWVCWAVIGAFKQTTTAKITFFDVGQGDAILFENFDGQALVIDTGPRSGSGKTVLNHLNSLSALDQTSIVLTHGHLDHLGGSLSLLKGMNDKNVVPQFLYHGGWLAEKERSVRLKRGDLLNLGKGIRGYILHPVEPGFSNDESVVLIVKVGPTSILLMGDAEAKTEQRITKTFTSFLQANILKVGHHGSKTSSTPPFVQLTNPAFSVISVGLANRFNHPNKDVLDRLEAQGSVVFTTANEGAVQFILGKSGFSRARW